MKLPLLHRLLIALSMTTVVALVLVNFFSTRPSTTYRQNPCTSNMKQVGTATAIYWSDYDDHMPLENWMECLEPTLKNPTLFVCPNIAKAKKGYGYAMKYGVVGIDTVEVMDPAFTVMYFETDALGRSVVANLAARSGRHNNGSIIVSFDTHARFRRLTDPVK